MINILSIIAEIHSEPTVEQPSNMGMIIGIVVGVVLVLVVFVVVVVLKRRRGEKNTRREEEDRALAKMAGTSSDEHQGLMDSDGLIGKLLPLPARRSTRLILL